MNKLFLSLVAIFLFTLTAQAELKYAPFQPEVDARFDCLEYGSCTAVGHGKPILIQKQINMAGWTANSTNSIGITLPPKTLIRKAYVLVKTQIQPSGVQSAIQCDSANDILTATDETNIGANSLIATTETGAAGVMHYSSAGCVVKMVNTIHQVSVGVWDLFMEVAPAL